MSLERSTLINQNSDIEDGMNIDERNTFMNRLRILGFSKSVKLWAAIEFTYDVYLTIALFWWYLFFSLFSLGGWYGAKNLEKKYVLTYFLSDMVKLVSKIAIVAVIDDTAAKIFTSIVIVLNMIYLFTIYRFYKSLDEIEEEDLVALKNGWTPRIVYFVI
jgi:hypothetical protein